MADGDNEKYHVSSLIQDFVFSSRIMGCIRCISSLVYNKKSNLVFIILICYMVNELTRAVNLFTGNSPAKQQPIKLE